MNKTTSAVITLALLVSLGIVFVGSADRNAAREDSESGENVAIKEGIQYVTVAARGGYTPRVSVAQANLPTVLVMTTNGTYDCSASLVIRAVGYQKILPATGEEYIDLGIRKPGEQIQGACAMGMFGFSIRFE